MLHQIIWKDTTRPCVDVHVTKSRNRKLMRVTSSNECLKDKCVDLSDYNIYLNQIWYRTQMPYYQHTGMAKLTKTENSRWRRPLSWISENVNNSGLDKDILHRIIREDASRQRGGDHMTKSRNRKLIRVTSSNECLKHMCVDISEYIRYVIHIGHRTQSPHYIHAGMAKFS